MLFQNAGDYVVLVRLGDFGAAEGAREEAGAFVGAEVVDEERQAERAR